MKAFPPRIANTLWQTFSYPAWWKFKRAAGGVERTQFNLLKDYLGKNKDTKYGMRYGFERIDSVSSFQKNVPITTYDDYIEEIDEIGNGSANVLTSSPVRMFEPSSGSTAPSKLIPYTEDLQPVSKLPRTERRSGVLVDLPTYRGAQIYAWGNSHRFRGGQRLSRKAGEGVG
jgi:hypothetical protein